MNISGHDLRQVADFTFRSAAEGLFAKRTGRDDHFGARGVEFRCDRLRDPYLLTVGNRRIGHRGAAAEGVLARRGRFQQLAHGFDHRPRLVVDAAPAPQLARVVVGETRLSALRREASGTNQPQDIFLNGAAPRSPAGRNPRGTP